MVLKTFELYRQNGLNAIETLFLNCVLGTSKGEKRSVLYYPSTEQAQFISSKLTDFSVSVHGPYAMSLTATNPKQIKVTKAHFTRNLKLADILNATHLTFHCGSMKHRNGSEERVKRRLKEIMELRNEKGYKTMPAPEIAGKIGSFADFHTILRVASEAGCLFCWDISHDFVRGGSVTTEAGLLKRLELIDDHIDLANYKLPIHISGIVGGKKGEKKHTLLDKGSGIPWKLFLSVLKQQNYLDKVVIICESKVEEKRDRKKYRIQDVLKMKDFLESEEIVKKYDSKKSRLDAFF